MISEKHILYDVAVVGAGPAGLIAAGHAAKMGAKIILLEKNDRPGKKLLLTGKERCNITQFQENSLKFVEVFGKQGKFFLSALTRFSVTDTIEFFNQYGVPTKIERGQRVFPESDKALDVLNALLRFIKKANVELRTCTSIQSLHATTDGAFEIRLTTETIHAKTLILCTGGLSYPSTGCSGDGYTWAKHWNHTVTTLSPALVGVVLNEPWLKDVQALELKHVRISLVSQGKKKDERFGDALFTHEGISGPIIIDMSKAIGEALAYGSATLELDLKPALNHDALDKRLLRELQTYKTMAGVFTTLLPRRLIPVIANLTQIDPATSCGELSRDARKRLLNLLKSFPLPVERVGGFEKAIITSGGVSLKEINPQTMESRLINGLYFAGEILDLDGPTGGYNLQVCWSTGALAGTCAVSSKLKPKKE